MSSVTIGTNLTSIGGGAFDSCTNLMAFTVNTLNLAYTSVAGVLFNKTQTILLECPQAKAETYTIPNTITSISDLAFSGCARLTNIAIGNSVTSIGVNAFSGCSGLTSVIIPDSVTNIGNAPFPGCSRLTAITVDTWNPVYTSVEGVLFDNSQTTLIEYPGGKAGACTISNSVTSIAGGAFAQCASLTSVIIPNSVTSIGSWAFSGCSGLTSVTIPNSVTNFGDDVFNGCTSLTNAAIPDSVTSFGDEAFFGCSKLTSIKIPNSVTRIGRSAFNGCTSLISLTIPKSVTSIGDTAFYRCTNLKGVYFIGNAPSVGIAVFSMISNATVYYLPNTTGWTSTFGGRPTLLWNPQVQSTGASFGVRTNRFGFTITGTSKLVVVVEACTNLANPTWSPVATNTLTNGSSYFSDARWTNYPARLYRLRSP